MVLVCGVGRKGEEGGGDEEKSKERRCREKRNGERCVSERVAVLEGGGLSCYGSCVGVGRNVNGREGGGDEEERRKGRRRCWEKGKKGRWVL